MQQQAQTGSFDVKDIIEQLRQLGFRGLKLWTGNRNVRIYINRQDYIEFYFGKPCIMVKADFGKYFQNNSKYPEIIEAINKILSGNSEDSRIKDIKNKIKLADNMAKYTGLHHIALEASIILESGKLDKAEKYLKSYGF